MATTPPTPPSSAAARQSKRILEEHEKQQRVVLASAAAIGLALLSLVIGLIYDQLWLPSRPVARVGETTLTRSGYWDVRRAAYVNDAVQNFQLAALLADNLQFAQQFQGLSPAINASIRAISRSEPEDVIVNAWYERRLLLQEAQTRGLTATDDEIAQAIVADLGPLFLPAAAPAPEPTTDPALAPTADPAAEPTAEPLPTIRPSPVAAVAQDELSLVLDEIYRLYELELSGVGSSAVITRDEFRSVLFEEYRETVLRDRLAAQLVPAETFVADSTPTRVEARQILVAVEASGDAAAQDAAFAAALPKAEELLKAVQDGGDFANIATAQSDDIGSAPAGGDLGFFNNDGTADNGAVYAPELVSAAFAAPPGLIAEPIRTQFGWHIVEITDQVVTPVEDQLATAQREALDAWFVEQRAAIALERIPAQTATPTAEATSAPTTVPTYLPGPPTPVPTAEPTVEPTATTTP
jgi:parvulin-like peptidyl-prolyl isomerase